MTLDPDGDTAASLFRCQIGRVPILVSRSWLVAFALSTIACTAAVYSLMPELPLGAILGLGLLLGVALSLALVLHELAHALVAINGGVEVDHIQLFAGGALCRRRQPIDAPRRQFVVAAAGPLASTAIAVAAVGIAVGAGALGGAPLATTLWLFALVNLLIAVANLLPVFPFNGGKLIHALLWRAGQDRDAASVRLERGGREFSRVIAALGLILMAFGGEFLIGLVVLLLGLYLLRLPPPA